MTHEERARQLVESHGITWQPESAFHRAIAAALAARERAVWKKVQHEVDELIRQGPLKMDWQQFSNWCRQQAFAPTDKPVPEPKEEP